MICGKAKKERLAIEAAKAKSQADFLFFANKIQVITNKGFASQLNVGPPVGITSQPISKASMEVLQPLFVQKQVLKSEKTKSPIPIISTGVFSFDFCAIDICS